LSNSIEQLIVDVKESLEREIRSFRDEMRDRFDTQAARMDRQGGLLRSGQTNLVRLNDWSEKIDAALEARDRDIAELRARITRLESERNRGSKP
jgi:phage shock protein A